jgi:hypothetical protein
MRAALGLAFVLACSAVGDRTVPPLQVSHSAEGDGTRLALVATPGIRINARLKPALELADGTILRFDSPRLTADSAYFAEPPSTLVGMPWKDVHGILRASICGDDAACRPFVLEL